MYYAILLTINPKTVENSEFQIFCCNFIICQRTTKDPQSPSHRTSTTKLLGPKQNIIIPCTYIQPFLN